MNRISYEKITFTTKSYSVFKTQHILVIRLSAMGDVAMAVPVIKAFTEQYPDIKITMVSKPFFQPLFADIPNVTFFPAEVKGKHKGFVGLYRLYKELSKLNITHVADLHNVLRSKIVRTFFRSQRVNVKFIDKGRAEKKALTRETDKVFKQLKTSHQRYADVFQQLGFPVNIAQPKPIQKSILTKKVIDLTGEKNIPWIGIAPFAAFDGKVYPIELMKQVIAELSKQYRIILFGGGKKEISLLNKIENEYSNTINVAGKLPFEEELSLISHLDIMLSMDSGNAHLAAMQRVKTITLWGVTHPYAGFAPYNQPADYCIVPDLEKYPKLPCSVYGNTIFEGYDKVMESILPKTIVEKVTQELA